MKYYVNGKFFDTEEEAVNYEAELKKTEEEKDKERTNLEVDIENAREAVNKASEAYSEALDTYIKLKFNNDPFGFWNNILDRRWE